MRLPSIGKIAFRDTKEAYETFKCSAGDFSEKSGTVSGAQPSQAAQNNDLSKGERRFDFRSVVALLQCDQNLDHILAFAQRLQCLAHNCTQHPAPVGAFHGIAWSG
jgi:hypothetical protein